MKFDNESLAYSSPCPSIKTLPATESNELRPSHQSLPCTNTQSNLISSASHSGPELHVHDECIRKIGDELDSLRDENSKLVDKKQQLEHENNQMIDFAAKQLVDSVLKAANDQLSFEKRNRQNEILYKCSQKRVMNSDKSLVQMSQMHKTTAAKLVKTVFQHEIKIF